MTLRERSARLVARVRLVTADQLFDAGGVAGVGLISAGAWQIYHPAGFITLGVLLLAGAWLNAKGKA